MYDYGSANTTEVPATTTTPQQDEEDDIEVVAVAQSVAPLHSPTSITIRTPVTAEGLSFCLQQWQAYLPIRGTWWWQWCRLWPCRLLQMLPLRRSITRRCLNHAGVMIVMKVHTNEGTWRRMMMMASLGVWASAVDTGMWRVVIRGMACTVGLLVLLCGTQANYPFLDPPLVVMRGGKHIWHSKATPDQPHSGGGVDSGPIHV